MNYRLIILIKQKNRARSDNNKIDYDGLKIKLRNVGGPGMVENIKVNILTNKSKTFILFGFYLNIVILSKFTKY